jgi:hypothetical protein
MDCNCGGVLEYSEIYEEMVCDACGCSPDSGDSDADYDSDPPVNDGNNTPAGFVPSPELQHLMEIGDYDDYKDLLYEEKTAYEEAIYIQRISEKLKENLEKMFGDDAKI